MKKKLSNGKDISAINIDNKNGTTILSATFSPAKIIIRPLIVKIDL